MFCRNNGRFCRNCNSCSNMTFDECDIEQACSYVQNYNCNNNMDNCYCGFDEEFNVFPTNPMYGQSYVPIQIMDRTFKPSVGLRNGTIFPELVSPYCPNQSIEEIEYIRATNSIGKGGNG